MRQSPLPKPNIRWSRPCGVNVLSGYASLKWSWRGTPGSFGPLLDLQPRVFEVPLDASSHLVADTSFAPEPEELRTLDAKQLPPETLVCQGAFLVAVVLLTALCLLAVAGGEASTTVFVEFAHPGEGVLWHPSLVREFIEPRERRLSRPQSRLGLLAFPLLPPGQDDG